MFNTCCVIRVVTTTGHGRVKEPPIFVLHYIISVFLTIRLWSIFVGCRIESCDISTVYEFITNSDLSPSTSLELIRKDSSGGWTMDPSYDLNHGTSTRSPQFRIPTESLNLLLSSL